MMSFFYNKAKKLNGYMLDCVPIPMTVIAGPTALAIIVILVAICIITSMILIYKEYQKSKIIVKTGDKDE